MRLPKRILMPALCVCFAVLACWSLWPERVTPQAARALTSGMSRAEVERVLGRPLDPNSYATMQLHLMGIGGMSAPPQPGRVRYVFAAQSAWDATLTLTGEPLPVGLADTGDLRVWAGSQVAILCVFRGDQLDKFYVAPVLRDGGGPWGWVRRKYQEWTSPAPTPIRARPLPSALIPNAPVTPAPSREGVNPNR